MKCDKRQATQYNGGNVHDCHCVGTGQPEFKQTVIGVIMSGLVKIFFVPEAGEYYQAGVKDGNPQDQDWQEPGRTLWESDRGIYNADRC